MAARADLRKVETMMFDGRAAPRRPVNLPAKLSTAPGVPLRNCVVLDISDAGARLGIDGAQDAPDEFIILFAPRGRLYRRCRVVWRTPTQLGVKFDRFVTSHGR